MLATHEDLADKLAELEQRYDEKFRVVFDAIRQRINLYLIRCPFPFTRSTRSALQSEGYGHPDGHLSSQVRLMLGRHPTDAPMEFVDGEDLASSTK
jgi:hypothetical protein